jgi:hypothetical protein
VPCDRFFIRPSQSTVIDVDRLIVLADGKLAEIGSPWELLNKADGKEAVFKVRLSMRWTSCALLWLIHTAILFAFTEHGCQQWPLFGSLRIGSSRGREEGGEEEEDEESVCLDDA